MSYAGERIARRAGRRRRVLAATALGAACAALAAGISGCGSAASTIDPVAKAAVISTSASGYKLALSMRISSPQLQAPITATGSGSFNTPQRSGSFGLDMDFSSIPQVAQVLGSGTLHLQEVTSGTNVYVKLPSAIASKAPAFGGRPWIKLDIAKLGAAAGIPGLSTLFSNPASSDPSQFLRYLRATAGNSVSTVGSETVNGVQTTHYHAQINLSRVPDAYPPSSRAAVQQAIGALERLTQLHQIPVDAWIDSQRLVRRMRFSIPETLPTGQSLATALSMDIIDYGPQPLPTLPPAGQVTDLSSLAGSLGGSSGSLAATPSG